jgi:hypothetical protein
MKLISTFRVEELAMQNISEKQAESLANSSTQKAQVTCSSKTLAEFQQIIHSTVFQKTDLINMQRHLMLKHVLNIFKMFFFNGYKWTKNYILQ